jgi:uncharacterized protein YcbK (DUF882 family)
MSYPRRGILRASGAAIVAGLAQPAFGGTLAASAGILAASQVRSLAFDNIHTGEKLKIDYWTNGTYVSDALGTINHLLRDYRNNQVHVIEPKLLDLLNLLHRTVGSNAAFQVISGYRSPATNAMLHAESHGVAAKSLHMQGMAIDIRLPDRALDHLHNAAQSLRLGGVGYYPASDFVHVDVGRVRYW